MTVYEHAMLGWTLALAAGCQRRHGWSIAGMCALAASLPDLDGLSLLWGAEAFARVHRVWFHNLLVSSALGLVAGVGGYLAQRSARVQQSTAAMLARVASDLKLAPAEPRAFSGHELAVWALLGVAASLSHLPADLVYNGGEQLPAWPVPLGWPFSGRGWQYPLVPWGDVGSAVLLVTEMFALYRWPGRAQGIACLTLVAVVGYVGMWWLMRG